MNTYRPNNAKLATYLAGAGAAGLATLPSDLEAEVRYTDFHPDISLSGGFTAARIRITINPPSALRADVTTSSTSDYNAISLFPASYRSWNAGGEPFASVGSTKGGKYNSDPTALERTALYRELCGGTPTDSSRPMQPPQPGPGNIRGGIPALEGNHYIGFEYRTSEGSSYYGWIRYAYTAPSDPESPTDSRITLLEGAIESTPETGIQFPGSCPIPPIPRLALGAIGMEADRLTMTWESKPGMIYNLKSSTDLAADPSTWKPVEVDGALDIPSTPPTNTHRIGRPDDAARFYRVEEYPKPPLTVFSDDFESGQGDWTTGSNGDPGSDWELGAPFNVGPAAANSGINCFGTNLDGDYDFNADVWLRSPAIDLTDAPEATLSYAQFANIEEGFDHWRVNVLDAADDSLIASVTSDGPTSLSWQSVSRKIPNEALGKVIKIEFRMESDNIQNFAGWYVDDVAVIVP